MRSYVIGLMKPGDRPLENNVGEGVMGELSNPRYEQFVQELAGNTAVFTMRARLEEVIHGYS